MELKQGIEPRKYQTEIAESVLRHGNTLVVLPTGLGKTLIAVLVMQKKLKEGAVLFLAPTKPLVSQHVKTINATLDGAGAVAVTGAMAKSARKSVWDNAKIIVATPQTVQSDLEHIDRHRFSLVVLDEVHRAVGDYAYTAVSQAFRPYSTILGLTASPGSKKSKIEEIRLTLGVSNVESREHTDDDVKDYVKEMDIEWVMVDEKPEYVEAKRRIEELIAWYLNMVRHYGFRVFSRSRKSMILAQQAIMKSGLKTKYHALKYLSAAINLDYAAEMLETQSMGAFLAYVENLGARETKGAQLLSKDGRLHEIIEYVKAHKVIHPKMERLVEMLSADRDAKYIVFSQYTAQIEYLEQALSMYGFRCSRFTGQRKGFTRKQQLDIIERFRSSEFNILIASSIGEEGLDIPSVDYVIFYEPIPSEIRSIQRRGRAGRAKKGFVRILITKNTRDEIAYRSSQMKEGRMRRIIRRMSKKGEPKPVGIGGQEAPLLRRKTGTLLDFM
ncbi:MAG: helicase-related protein [Candidatus Micrarchaeia archaeon]